MLGGIGSRRTLSFAELFSWDFIVSSHNRSCYDRMRLALPESLWLPLSLFDFLFWSHQLGGLSKGQIHGSDRTRTFSFLNQAKQTPFFTSCSASGMMRRQRKESQADVGAQMESGREIKGKLSSWDPLTSAWWNPHLLQVPLDAIFSWSLRTSQTKLEAWCLSALLIYSHWLQQFLGANPM